MIETIRVKHFVAFIVLILFSIGCGSGSPNIFNELSTVPIEGVSLKTSTSILANGKETLYPVLNPLNTTEKKLKWSSDSEAIATVDSNGTVTGISAGVTTIRATTKNGKLSSACTVTVSGTMIPVTGISFGVTSTSLIVSEMRHIAPTITPSSATNQNLTWESSFPSAVSVTPGGVITALTTGWSVISAKTVDGGFVAQYIANVSQPSISIAYNGNGHTSDSLPGTVNQLAGTPFIVAANPAPDSGYMFCGWNTASNGSGAWYDPFQTVIPISNTTLYAQWIGISGTTVTSVPAGAVGIVIPEGITTVTPYILRSNTLRSVSIPSTLISLGSQPLTDCQNLETITSASPYFSMVNGGLVDASGSLICVPAQYSGAFEIDSSITNIEASAFSKCSQITTITFEASSTMTMVPGNAFSDLTSAAHIIIPEGMTSVAGYAFYNCGASRIDFPSTMVSIDTVIFGNNTNLAAIYLNATSPRTGLSGSTGLLNAGSVTVYVPSSVLSAYQSSEWYTTYGLAIVSQ